MDDAAIGVAEGHAEDDGFVAKHHGVLSKDHGVVGEDHGVLAVGIGYHTRTMPGLKEVRAFPSLPPAARAALVARLAATLAEYDDVAYAWAYGSSVEGLPFRDVDVAVARRALGAGARDAAGTDTRLDANEGSDSLAWSFALADALSKAIGMPVDVQLLDDAPASFRASAYRGLLICAADEVRLADDLERTAIERCEFEVHRRRMTRWALGVP